VTAAKAKYQIQLLHAWSELHKLKNVEYSLESGVMWHAGQNSHLEGGQVSSCNSLLLGDLGFNLPEAIYQHIHLHSTRLPSEATEYSNPGGFAHATEYSNLGGFAHATEYSNLGGFAYAKEYNNLGTFAHVPCVHL